MQSTNPKTFETLTFDNLALKALPVDKDKRNITREVPGACFSIVDPEPVENPKLVATSLQAMSLIDLDQSQADRKDAAEYLCGNKVLPGARPAAHCYCGHQFGYFSGQLGDGATMYLGEVINSRGERWEIQFKGAGKTPYSRSADGRKVLRSSIREFLCSEAMHSLGIPTTRAMSCVTSDTRVVRDMFYTGNQIMERATVIVRMAQTFIRFGSFEVCKPRDETTGRAGPSAGKIEVSRALLEYTLSTFYPEIMAAGKAANHDQHTMYINMFEEIVRRSAILVAEWQCVGWCHGVLNTDNMSIVGVTIDYGPFGFMDRFDRDLICNTSDDSGRYSYSKQPEMVKWNCGKLAEAFALAGVPLRKLTAVVDKVYDSTYERHYFDKMRAKLGLVEVDGSDEEKNEDRALIDQLFDTMHATGADMTNTIRCLSRVRTNPDLERSASKINPGTGVKDVKDKSKEEKKSRGGGEGEEGGEGGVVEYVVAQCATVDDLINASQSKYEPEQLRMLIALLKQNPIILQQHGIEPASVLREVETMKRHEKLKTLSPKDKRAGDHAQWTQWLDMYRHRLAKQERKEGVKEEEAWKRRSVQMNKLNPKFVLRNYVAQHAISRAEKGDFSEVQRVLQILQNPYEERVEVGMRKESEESTAIETYDAVPPKWGTCLKVSCSS